jgi:hypothetical protein
MDARELVAVFACAVLVSSCSKSVILGREELKVSPPVEIVAVTKKGGERIPFLEGTGKYVPSSQIVTGVSNSGTRVTFALANLSRIEQSITVESQAVNDTVTVAALRSENSDWRLLGIKSVTTLDGNTVMFRGTGGALDFGYRTIRGETVSNTVKAVPLDSIKLLSVKKTSVGNAAIIGGIAVLVYCTMWVLDVLTGPETWSPKKD